MRRVLPHFCIILAVSALVLLVIDQINSAMGMIDNQGSKIILMVLCAVSVAVSIALIASQRKR